ncbi:TetR/AcrR family transcriptional regulator [Terrilactibacillus laevilacticus]|uniref:TetR/AcrR family transcriptional regulator n=1 Tax=Terrilactibacillus laevilacticus TaxID=1380157 RepID=UPI0011475362|nr:TetR/AcrR family transcriptional regulator [Terrilactibacillus laevilacticus]
MNITKQDIVNSATKLFRENGYLNTSVQDIANDYGIAKGSIYKHFKSKEDLFSEVFDQCQNTYFEKVEILNEQRNLSSREKFLQQIILRFQYFMEYKYILVEFTELPIQQDEKFKPLRQRVRARLISWHKECLESVYSDKIKPFLWDLIFIYRAILKEYLFWIIYEDHLLSMEETAKFILDKLDILVENMHSNQSTSLIKKEAYEDFMSGGMAVNHSQIIADILESAVKIINELPYGKAYQNELHELMSILKSELDKENRNKPLLHAVIHYLEREKQLRSLMIQLKNLT